MAQPVSTAIFSTYPSTLRSIMFETIITWIFYGLVAFLVILAIDAVGRS